jgi:hypothetical protein
MRSKKITAVIVTGERGGDEGVCGVLEIYSWLGVRFLRK